jgi:isopenicillin-N epimerase
MIDYKSQFQLNPNITFLNFGSFGACPKIIFADYQKWQRQLEYSPVQFLTVTGLQHLQASREALGSYINCDANDVVYVTNPSYAVNLVAKSFKLQVGDEVLATNLEYGACDKTWEYYCTKAGAKYVKQNINLPIKNKETFLKDFFEGINNNTKLIFISHITSSTGLIFPIQEICDYANDKGIMIFIDGAHAPGQVHLDLQQLQVDIYTGACHKWMMAPKGCSFLYVKKQHQHLFDPLVISWGFNAALPSHSLFLDYHQLQGTRDFSAFLTVPACIQFMKKNNWEIVSKKCQLLVLQNAQRFCDLVNSQPIAPLSSEFIGQLFSIPIKTKDPLGLKAYLFDQYNIEIPVMPHGDLVFLRYSIQAFNTQQDLDLLYAALQSIIATTNFIDIP